MKFAGQPPGIRPDHGSKTGRDDDMADTTTTRRQRIGELGIPDLMSYITACSQLTSGPARDLRLVEPEARTKLSGLLRELCDERDERKNASREATQAAMAEAAAEVQA